MQIVVEDTNIREAVAAGQQPAALIRRRKERDAEWKIAQERIAAQRTKPLAWSTDRGRGGSGLVRVPLFAYQTAGPLAETLLRLGLQLGIAACQSIPEDWKVDQIVLAVGEVFPRPDGKPGYQIWSGFAVRMAV